MFSTLRRLGLVWIIPAALGVVNIVTTVRNATPLTQPWQDSNGVLLDFRDLVVLPGRFLIAGGNPYDPALYLAANPWAQEFDPYLPSWLLISIAIGWLPLAASALVYLVAVCALSFATCKMLARWISPAQAWWLGPAIASWGQIWFPMRVLGSSFICVCGFALLMWQLAKGADRRSSWFGAVGLAVLVIKPQLGVPVALFLLAYGLWQLVFRAIVVQVAASLPTMVACTIAAGGPAQFVDSIIRDVQHASSGASPTGLGISESFRTDVAGLYTRVVGEVPGVWLYAVVVTVFVGLLVFVALVKPRQELLPAIVVMGVYLLPVNLSYDIALMIVPAAAAAALLVRHKDVHTLILVVLTAIPIAHLHRITLALGLDKTPADVADVACVFLAGAWAAFLSMRTRGTAYQSSQIGSE